MAGSTDDLPDPNDSVHAALQLDKDPGHVRSFYDRWADTYDDTAGYLDGYAAKHICVDLLAGVHEPGTGGVIDIGCGTGVVGELLAERGFTDFDGVDLSDEMAAKAAAKGIYRSVTGGIDITGPLPGELAGAYRSAVVCGVFTTGHVPPEALANVMSAVEPGGHVVLSVRAGYEEVEGFRSASLGMQARGMVELVSHLEDEPYTPDSLGDYYVFCRPR